MSSAARFGRMRVAMRTSPPIARFAIRCCSASRSRQANATLVRWSFGTAADLEPNHRGFNRLADEEQRRQSEEAEETRHVRDGRHEDGGGDRRVHAETVERHRNEDASETRREI